ncbi:MAG: hypothetical protein DID89_2727546507 [Candidatus Nitrotoga sp. CP45]|nr:MAG: hypothetical protein DID89_2727546507 [Candidatus Nitrotoga sp. CP45]
MNEHRQNAVCSTHGLSPLEALFLQIEKVFLGKAMRYSKLPLAVVL